MFTKCVEFNLYGGFYLSRVIEKLSEYRLGIFDTCHLRIINIPSEELDNNPAFIVRIRIKKDDLMHCLEDVLTLVRDGASISELTVK